MVSETFNNELLNAIRTYREAETEKERSLAAEAYRHLTSESFTAPHFMAWASGIILDDGKPWILDPFQYAFLEDFFGGYPESWLVVPEGNGKTTLIAGLALYHIEHTRGGFVPVGASSRDQAENLFRQAEKMVVNTPGMSKEFKVQEGYRRIKHLATGSRIQIFAADDRTGDGVIPTLAICDELHRHRDLRLYRTWRGKLEKRDGQLVAISTAGEPGGEFETTRARIRQQGQVQRDGCFLRAVGDGVVLHEWSVPKGADYKDLQLVKQANPFSGITVSALAAKFGSPTMTIPHWQRFVCNVASRTEAAAITEAEWSAAAVDEGIPEGEPIWLGLDVGWKWDTTAMAPLWTPDPEFRLLGPATILVPPRDGKSLSPHLIEDALREINAANPVKLIVMDTTRAEQLAMWIEEELGCEVVDRTQTNKNAVQDYNAFMEGLRSGWLHHAGDEGLLTHVHNATVKLLPGGDARFDRPKKTVNTRDQDRRVIDALVAAAMVNHAYDATIRRVEAAASWRPA